MEFDTVTFPVTFAHSNLIPVTDTISKGRCHIFYKGLNRNGSYISDEFADKLVATLPYTPVKGIYEADPFDEESGDYTDHGNFRTEGRIYGIVPQNPNFAWEKHLDKDGVTREYASCDVYVYTGIYQEEAQKIFERPQSMELYIPSIKGYWDVVDGRKCFRYLEASFLGLQVLGQQVEPCFEGSEFFTLVDDLKNFVQNIDTNSFKDKDGGEEQMFIFKNVSDQFNLIWSLLNPNYSKENDTEINYIVLSVDENFALAKRLEDNTFVKVAFSKAEDSEEITLGEITPCYILEVNEAENNSLQIVKEKNNGSFEKAEETFEKVTSLTEENSALSEKNSEFEQKIVEKDETISTLTTERDKAVSDFTTLQEANSEVIKERDSLKEFKLNAENAEKMSLINTYTNKISEDEINNFKAKIGEFSYADLKKELAFAFVEANPSIFTKDKEKEPSYTPKESSANVGIDAILEKYKK